MKNIVIPFVFLFMASQSALAQTNEEIVQKQLAAYNNKDLESYISMFSDEVQLYNFPGEMILKGKEQMRERYKIRFESPNLNAVVVSRTLLGAYVIDHEKVSGIREEIVEASVIYHISDGLIDKMWFIIK
ncbi:MAG TPA: hypothetical protein VIS49_13825 [Cyclobacteriaceae bacterium]